MKRTTRITRMGKEGFEEVNITDYTINFGPCWKDIIFIPFYRLFYYLFTWVVYLSLMNVIFITSFQPEGKLYNDLNVIDGVFGFIYVIRTILATLHRIYSSHRSRKIYPPDPIILLVCDYFTLIPISTYCHIINRFNWHDPIYPKIGYYYSYYIKLPRIVRLLNIYYNIRCDLSRNPKTVLIGAHLVMSSLIIAVLASIYYYIFWQNERSWGELYGLMENTTVTYITPILCFLYAGSYYFNDILAPMPDYSIYEMALAASALLLSCVAHNVFLISQMVAIYVQLMRFQHLFEWRLLKVGRFMTKLHFDEGMQNSINTYYRTIWNIRHGFVELPEIVSLFPWQLKTEIAMDLYFDAIRHTNIFEPLGDSVKKELSCIFQTEIYIPGQILFKKDAIKCKLVYLHSGIVEIMSNENIESPVLALSPGTIMGEVSCLVPYMCNADIRCSTTCVCHVLRHRSLVTLLSRDKNLATSLREIVTSRVQYAKKKMQKFRRLENPVSHIYWIKDQWRRLIQDESRTSHPLNMYYSSRYLSLLVISSYYELKVHSICIRGKCSFVMEQDSSFRQFLDYTCLFFVILNFFLTFHKIIFVGKIDGSQYALLTIIDVTYVLDIYLQAITAIRLPSIFITSPMEILVHRFKQFKFLIDLFASLPYDYFVLLMGSEEYYVGLCRLPRYIKLYKVVEFFATKEQSLTFSMKTIKIGKTVTIHTLLIILSACFFYIQNCFNNECEPTGWLQLFRKDSSLQYHQNLSIDDFSIEPNRIWDLVSQFVISVGGFYLVNLTLMYLSGAVALDNYPRFLYMWTRTFLVSMTQERPEVRRMRPKINDYFALHWFYCHNMKFADISKLMTDESVFVRQKVTRDFVQYNLKKTALFSKLSDQFLELIGNRTDLYIIPAGHVLQKQETGCAFLYVVLEGYCKVKSYAPDDFEKGATYFYTTYDVFPIVGFFHQVNSFLEVVTYTTVKLFCISFHDFSYTRKAISQDGAILSAAIAGHLDASRNLIMRIVHLPLLHYPDRTPLPHIDTFDYHPHDVENVNKNLIGWGNIGLTLPYREKILGVFTATYDPNGKYVYYESFRCLFIMFDTIFMYTSLNQQVRLSACYQWIRYIGLGMHVFDMFIRAHIQYYTLSGIRVRRPLLTFKYYFHHGFIIDLFVGIPYEKLRVLDLFNKQDRNFLEVLIFLHTKPVMLYRPYRLLLIIRKTSGIQYHTILLFISHSMSLFFFMAQLTAYTMICSCDLEEDWSWQCPYNSWINTVWNHKLWQSRDYLLTRTFYEIISLTILRSSILFSFKDFMTFLVMALLVMMARLYYCAMLIGYHVFNNKSMANYQNRKRIYNKFASRMDIPKAIRDELNDHYKFKTNNPEEQAEILNSLYPYLRELIQLDLYAPTLQQSPVFVGVPYGFYSFLVPCIREEFFKMDGQIVMCNDIVSDIFFVKQGWVQISIADHITTVLGVGGAFGCFSYSGTIRVSITATTKVHTVVLVIDAKTFLDLIKPYPTIVHEMRMMSMTNQEYIDSYETLATSMYNEENLIKKVGCLHWYQYTFDEDNAYIMFYLYFTQMHVAPIVSIATLAVIVLNTSDAVFYCCPCVDVFFLFDMYMTCHIRRRISESGLPIYKVNLLTKQYLLSLKFCVDVITLVPLYLFKMKIKYHYAGGLLLANKALRIINMIIYYQSYMRSRFLPNHIRFTFLYYISIYGLTGIYMFLWTVQMIFFKRTLTDQEITSGYLFVLNVFTTSGLEPLPVPDIYSLIYVTVIIVMTKMLHVWLLCGFSKWALTVSFGELDFRRAVITFKAYCYNDNVSKPIIDQSCGYLMHLYAMHGGEQFPTLICNAPNYIRQAHMFYMWQQSFSNHPLFRNAHCDFIRQLMLHLNYEFIMPGYTIIEAGDKKKRMYFLVEGRVLAFVIKDTGDQYKLLEKGASFGELQAMKGHRFQKTFKAVTTCQVFYMVTKHWSYLLKWFPATEKTMLEAIKNYEL